MTTRRHLASWISVGLTAVLLSTPSFAATPSVLDPANVAAAKTAAQHEAIAKAYEEEAGTFERRAVSHGTLARDLGAPGLKGTQASMAKHCAAVATALQSAAKESRALAADHRKMAKETGA